MFKLFLQIIYLILLLCITNCENVIIKSSQRISCHKSLDTIKEVPSCPNSKKMWDERAALKECESVSQTCSEKEQLKYHCVNNAWGNGLIEVCALETTITGMFCPQFNNGGKIIQEHFLKKCNNFSNPCPFKYPSVEGYKYPECTESKPTVTTCISPKGPTDRKTYVLGKSGSKNEINFNEIIDEFADEMHGSTSKSTRYQLEWKAVGICLAFVQASHMISF